MRKIIATIMAVGTLMFLANPALADWFENDPHKMHEPQLPDPDGWDVRFDDPLIVLADDWRCSATGPVSDIHFWLSSREDNPFAIEKIHVSIHKDDRTAAFSKPGELLWERDFNRDEFTVREEIPSLQGWFDPSFTDPPSPTPNDHQLYFQANIEGIPDPFTQEEGNIYWLDLSVAALSPNGERTQLGWKTSRTLFEDHPVWSTNIDPGATPEWRPIDFPGEPFNLAFVITPEPGTTTMLLGAAVGLLAWASRRRRS